MADIAGRADVVIGIRDETRAAINQMRNTLSTVLRQTAAQGTAALRPLEQSISRVARGGGRGGTAGGFGAGGTGGFGAGRRGGRDYGAFGGANQLGFLIEDVVVSAQLNGFSGAVRAGANNLTLMSLAFGGLRAQMLATAAVVAATLLPAFFKMQGQAKTSAELIKQLKEASSEVRNVAQSNFDRREIGLRALDIGSSEAASARISDIEREIRQRREVGIPVANTEINTIRQMLANFAQSEAAGNWADRYGQFASQLFAGAESPADRKRILQDEIKAREQLIRGINREIETLELEKGQVTGRRGDLLTIEAQKGLKENITRLFGELDPLIGPDEARLRAGRERNEQLAELLGKAGVNDGGLLGDLAQLDRLRIGARKGFTGLPSTLDQTSVAAAQQSYLNRGNQTDPAVREMADIKRIAAGIRDKIDSILDQISIE